MHILASRLATTTAAFCAILALVSGCGTTPDLFGDKTTTTGGAGGAGGGGAGGGIGGEAGGSSDALRVAIIEGPTATDALRDYLDARPDIEADMLNACLLGDLMAYDVAVVHGQMVCFENDDFNTFVVNGGGLVGVAWVHDNGEVIALPVTPELVNKETNASLEVFPVVPDDPLLADVAFEEGDIVGYERGALPPRPEAAVVARWGDGSNTSAVARWAKGEGRAVYLNFLYVHNCCPSAVDYGWGQQLVENAVRWAAGD